MTIDGPGTQQIFPEPADETDLFDRQRVEAEVVARGLSASACG